MIKDGAKWYWYVYSSQRACLDSETNMIQGSAKTKRTAVLFRTSTAIHQATW